MTYDSVILACTLLVRRERGDILLCTAVFGPGRNEHEEVVQNLKHVDLQIISMMLKCFTLQLFLFYSCLCTVQHTRVFFLP